jgi:hypothetical protein
MIFPFSLNMPALSEWSRGLKISPKTIRKAEKAGRLHGYNPTGRRNIFSKSEMLACFFGFAGDADSHLKNP